MGKTRFLMIGGFLGAGKTTTIARLAKYYTDQGLRVGLVTNDQAFGLVDTESLRAQGFHVGEVPGACFCCKFEDLVDTAAALGKELQPDILLTEPVGSCTDLAATVIQPLRHLFGDRYTLAPLAVICKPEHGRKILSGDSGGFSPQAAYIFLKQLEEAELILLNKIDRLDADEMDELISLLTERFPGKKVQAISSLTGEGYEAFISALQADTKQDFTAIEVDYDTYAEGEAALGWLNASVRFEHPSHAWKVDDLVIQLVQNMKQLFEQTGMEPGHLKVLASVDDVTAVANWVASDAPVDLSVPSGKMSQIADLLVNVRVHGDPEHVSQLVEEAISKIADAYELKYEISSNQYFRPGRPEPIHRYATPTG